jgi:hypothetical protein
MRKAVRVPNEVIETYKVGKFYVEICKESDDTYTAYLHHEEYSIKMGMFGVGVGDVPYAAFVEYVFENLTEHIKLYKERFFDE